MEKSPSSGLGLTFCKLAVEAHGGSIGVISEAGQGGIFWFALPE
ncbi:MAG: ATP-binding protein [Candidatus Margulisiibacteriota bacterium]